MEPKFRAWDEPQKIMVYPGDMWKPINTKYPKREVRVCNDSIVYPYEAPDGSYVRVVDDNGNGRDYYSNWDYDKFYTGGFIFEQYIGLKDKNGDGVEIWEGDVVESCWQVDQKVRILGFVKYYSQFGLYSLEDSKGDMVSPCWSDCKVIGDIHQDPTLLKEKSND